MGNSSHLLQYAERTKHGVLHVAKYAVKADVSVVRGL